MSFYRLIPWTSPILVLAVFETLIGYPESIFWTVPVATAIVFFSIWFLTGRKFKKLKFWNFLISPLLLVNSGWIFLIFLEGKLFKHVFLFFLVILLWIFLKVVFLYFHLRPKYQAHAIENVSGYLNLITIFLLFGGFFNLFIFLGLPFGLLVLAGLISTALLTYQVFWVSEISLISARPYILIITLITMELFLSIRFLPTSAYVNSLVIAIGYYLLTGLGRNWLLNIKEPKVIRRYLAISLISLVIVLITAKWI